MRFGVLGTGVVGQTIAGKLVSLGNETMMGSRRAANATASEWARGAGEGAREGSFRDAARFGEIVVNATAGAASVDALTAAGADNLAGKVVIDIANPLDFSSGMPPTLTVCNSDSLGEQIQRAFPEARVVKALNTINADVMVDPGVIAGAHAVFICGDDSDAKGRVSDLLRSFGWAAQDIIDLGGIAAARGTEMYLALWLRLMGTMGTALFNIKIATAQVDG